MLYYVLRDFQNIIEKSLIFSEYFFYVLEKKSGFALETIANTFSWTLEPTAYVVCICSDISKSISLPFCILKI